MEQKQQRIPPLKALVAFESVVRRGSMTAAAEELFVTHSAVSKQIATLEAWVGEPLFAESRRMMMPTPAAARLADSVGMAMRLISKSLEAFAEREASGVLRVLAPSTFAMRWLLPRLPDFQVAHPEIRVQVRQTHTPENWLEMPFDVAIRRGGPVPPHFKAAAFFHEELGLVCRSDLLAAHRHLPLPELLPNLPLLSVETRPGELENWLVLAGAPVRAAAEAMIFPHFHIALEAALGGRGALVAPIDVIEQLLSRRELVEVGEGHRLKGPDYLAIHDQFAPDGSPQALFSTWLGSC